MSTCSSVLFIFNFYKNIIPKTDSTMYFVLGIVSIVFLSIVNIIYFISAYFSYGYFELKFFEKLGAKEILHRKYKINFFNLLIIEIFYWVQFNNSMMKSDFGFILIFLMSSYIFDFNSYVFLFFDSIIGIALFVNIYIMRIAVK